MLKYFVIVAIISNLLVIYSLEIQPCNAKNYYFNSDDLDNQICRAYTKVWIPGWKEYIIEVAQSFLYEIDDYGLCNVPLPDYTENISRNFFGYELKGWIKYTNGFIGTMQRASLVDSFFMEPTANEPNQTVSMKCMMALNDFILYYDYFVYLTKGNFSGTVGIPAKEVRFYITVSIHYDGNNASVQGNLDIYSTSKAANKIWDYLPTNKYLEIINRQNEYDFYERITVVLKTSWHTLLNNVLRKIPIPDSCFNCNSKTT